MLFVLLTILTKHVGMNCVMNMDFMLSMKPTLKHTVHGKKLGLSEPSWNIPASEPEWLPACLDRANNMFQRDKNHASVIIWSCGNESYAGKDIADMADYFRSVDNTRPVHYEGVTWCREFDYITDIESRMYAKPADIEEYLTNNPQKTLYFM